MKGVRKVVIDSLIKHHIPGIIPKAWNLNPTNFKLYHLVLHACVSDPNGLCSASNEELSAIMGESVRAIGYHLKQLEMLEFIEIKRVNQYVRQIRATDTDRTKRFLERQKGISEPEWMDEFMTNLSKVGQ